MNMKHLKKFEGFDPELDMRDTECSSCEPDEDENEGEGAYMYDDESDYDDDDTYMYDDDEFIPTHEKKKNMSYSKSGLKNPKKADLDKDKKISSYEKKRGKSIQNAMEDDEEEDNSKGLTASQKKLPKGLRDAIMKRKK